MLELTDLRVVTLEQAAASQLLQVVLINAIPFLFQTVLPAEALACFRSSL